MKISKIIKVAISATVLLIICIVFVINRVPETGFKENARKFDSKIWLDGDKEGGLREEMYDDITINYLPKLKTQSEIVSILGKPDKENEQSIDYLLSVGFDPCYLRIYLENNKVAKFNRECN
jgi:hypothetical protein